MIRSSFLILLSVCQIVSQVEESDLDSFEWIVTKGERKPTLKLVIKEEIIELPLRQAPFCHLPESKKCECFILRKDENTLKWDVASFVKCGDEVRGNFMNGGKYFEIAPKRGDESGTHIAKNFVPEVGSTEGPPDEKSNDDEKDRISKVNVSIPKFFKPLPEYGQLFENETGYIETLFVVTNRMYDFFSPPEIDLYLSNYINDCNQIMSKLNLLMVYRGWVEASPIDTNMTNDTAARFVHEDGYQSYDKWGAYDAIILYGPGENLEDRLGCNSLHSVIYRNDDTSELFYLIINFYSFQASLNQMSEVDAMCHGSPGHFVKYFTPNELIDQVGRKQLQLLLYSLGKAFGIPRDSERLCGKPPEGTIWIMENYGLSPGNGTLEFADCSVEFFKWNKKNLACLRKNFKPSRPSCGNGIVEDDEQCDCVARNCKKCCDENCHLAKNATCSNGPCCDLSKCQFFNDLKQCRASEDMCDIPELCDGKSSECSPNYVVANGYKCRGSLGQSGYCFNGMCGNGQDVCGWAFLEGNVADEMCFDLNEENGKDYGGCGPLFQSEKKGKISYFACSSKNKFCGKIFCTQPGMKYSTEIRYTEQSRDYFYEPHTLYSGIEKEVCAYMGLSHRFRSLRDDPTFVPNGSPCAYDKMCVNQTCTSLPTGCPNNCPGERIVHPYTGETFPAYVLGTRPRDGSDTLFGSPFWLKFLLLACLLLLAAASLAYFIDPELSRTLKSENSSPERSEILSKSVERAVPRVPKIEGALRRGSEKLPKTIKTAPPRITKSTVLPRKGSKKSPKIIGSAPPRVVKSGKSPQKGFGGSRKIVERDPPRV